jgi:hypothetical protein
MMANPFSNAPWIDVTLTARKYFRQSTSPVARLSPVTLATYFERKSSTIYKFLTAEPQRSPAERVHIYSAGFQTREGYRKMKRFNRIALALVVAAGAFGLHMAGVRVSLQSVRADGFTNDSLKGTYGFSSDTTQGSLGSSSRLVGYGRLAADGNGGISGVETVNDSSGNLVTTQFVGVYSINQDGTGTMTLNYLVPDSGNTDNPTPVPDPGHLNFVLVNDHKEIRGIRTDPGVTSVTTFVLQ